MILLSRVTSKLLTVMGRYAVEVRGCMRCHLRKLGAAASLWASVDCRREENKVLVRVLV